MKDVNEEYLGFLVNTLVLTSEVLGDGWGMDGEWMGNGMGGSAY